MPLLLAFDTAGSHCSVALCDEGQVLAYRHESMARGQAEALFPIIQSVLSEAGAGYAELEGLAVTTGPGSFTGLRIGLAAARGIVLAASIPALGVTSFDALLQAMPEAEIDGRAILVALDSKRSDPYFQLYSATREPLSSPNSCLPEEVLRLIGDRPVVVIGDGIAGISEAFDSAGIDYCLGDAPLSVDARSIATLAERNWPPSIEAGVLEPLYLRSPDTTSSDGTPSRTG
ncbi:MAG: tRNA (adenosine(37)-N6)-threonylcarbamoyltransferase complex dimerization subunit type 1 TsaB [Proteobacteria bacterium]|nr:tRNA (adenosine(37)-N6)-threonylcarbamoyltransferase complex dimerization subunit type 1 TsaB [Pseudomonadota bacterium]